MINLFNFLAIYEDSDINFANSLLISLVSVLIVFIVLAIIILISSLFSNIMHSIDKKTKIMPREENKILESDEDALIASLVATIDFYKTEKKDAKLVSIKRID